MRTTIELPDELLMQAKSRAALNGISLREFFIDSVRQRLANDGGRTRGKLPVVRGPAGPPLTFLTQEEIDEAMFG